MHDIAPLEKITIGNVKEYSFFNIVVKNNGYFHNNGLDAAVNEYESGPAAMKDMLAGRADFALASEVPDYLDNIYFDGLEKVKPDSITITQTTL